jgi:hypothetical protein
MEQKILEFLTPEEWQSTFELSEIIQKEKEINLILREKKNLIPKELIGKDVVLNGYCNFVEIIDFPFRGKAMYFKFYRRRWKEKNAKEDFSNNYEFHRPGMKVSDKFASFLKGLNRKELDEFFDTWDNLRHIRKEDFQVVQKRFKWF